MTLTDADGMMLARSLIILRSENWEDAKRGAEALQLFMEMENNKMADDREMWDQHILGTGKKRREQLRDFGRAVKRASDRGGVPLREVLPG